VALANVICRQRLEIAATKEQRLTLQSGGPLTILAGKDQSNTGLSQDRAVITGSPYGSTACLIAATCVSYLNTSSFALPAVGGFGNVGKGLLVGPDSINLDAGLVKVIPMIRERVRASTRRPSSRVHRSSARGPLKN
jgi:hypothetical protein